MMFARSLINKQCGQTTLIRGGTSLGLSGRLAATAVDLSATRTGLPSTGVRALRYSFQHRSVVVLPMIGTSCRHSSTSTSTGATDPSGQQQPQHTNNNNQNVDVDKQKDGGSNSKSSSGGGGDDVEGVLRLPFTKERHVRAILAAFMASFATAYHYASTVYDEEVTAHGSSPAMVAVRAAFLTSVAIGIQPLLPPAMSLSGGGGNALTVGFAAVSSGFFGVGSCKAVLRSWGAPPVMQAPAMDKALN